MLLSSDLPILHGREIDEALRPGVYSLIDICEENDFQQLHTYLGGMLLQLILLEFF